MALKTLVFIFIPVLTWIPILLTIHWIRRNRNRLLLLSNDNALREIRSLRLSGLLSQVGLLILGSSAYSLLGEAFHISKLVYIPLVFFFASVWIQGQVCGELEQKLRRISASPIESARLRARLWAAFAISYGLYIGVLFGTIFGINLIAQKWVTSPGAQEGLILMATPLGIFFGLGCIYVLAPVFVQLMFPTREMTLEDSEGVLGRLTRECFGKAGLPLPRVRSIELEKFQVHNAMVAGLPFLSRWIRPSLFITRSLLEKLTEDELRAVILHEVSHLKLNHLLKRFFFSFAAVILSVGPVTLFYVFARTFAPLLAQHGSFIFSVLIAFSFQIWLLRKQVRKHEIEADLYAVRVLGASSEALGGALKKLDQAHMMSSQKKDPLSLLNPSSAHPTTEERIQLMKEVA